MAELADRDILLKYWIRVPYLMGSNPIAYENIHTRKTFTLCKRFIRRVVNKSQQRNPKYGISPNKFM